MASILDKLTSSGSGGQQIARPPAAVEVTSEGVIGAALNVSGTPTYAYQPLPKGALKPGMAEPNLLEPEKVVHAIRGVLDAVQPSKHSVTLVVPDLSARVFMLDFDSLPAKASEATAVLRFRLRKMVPFDVEKARLSYQVLEESRTGLKLLVAVIPGEILAEYESAVRNAGYEPGAVVPAGLAVLSGIEHDSSALVANLGPLSLTTIVANGQDLLLYRTVELPEDEEGSTVRQNEVQRDLAVAAAYYEDRMGKAPTKLHYAGNGGTAKFIEWAGEPDALLASMELADIAPAPERGAATAMGSVSVAAVQGVLAGVN